MPNDRLEPLTQTETLSHMHTHTDTLLQAHTLTLITVIGVRAC